jgi:hypothetical protein
MGDHGGAQSPNRRVRRHNSGLSKSRIRWEDEAMESTMPPDVPEFRRACDTIVRFVHAHNGLTKDEREVVVNVVRSLDQELAPSHLDGPPLGAPLSNMPLID